MTENYQCEELIASTKKFIYLNFATVAETEHFFNLPSHEIEKWISSDDIVIKAEEDVFKVILKWIDCDKSDKRDVKFSDLCRHVLLTCVSRDVLVSDFVTNDLATKDCMDGVTYALTWTDRALDYG